MFEPTKLVIVAWSAVLVQSKCRKPPLKLSLLPATPAVIVAVPALLVSRKFKGPSPKTLICAGPAVLELVNSAPCPTGKGKFGAFAGMAWIPLPVILKPEEGDKV